MKILSYISFIALVAGLASCSKKDNYDAPASQLTGALLYNGDSVHVEYDRVPFQLYQSGFGKTGAIEGSFDQSGVMHALLFNGAYKFIIPNGQGPFMWKTTAAGDPDTLAIDVNGNTKIDIAVTPYYLIRNPQITGSGSTVSATFKVEKIITGVDAKDVENVTLFVNKTQFVSGTNNIANAGIAGSDITDMNNVSLSVSVPAIVPTQNFVYARIGLKIAGVEDRIFSPVVRINL